jgi:hypothetical protein
MDERMDLPDNSKMGANREADDIRVRKTIPGAEIKKKSLGRKFMELMTPADKVDVKGYLVNDVLLPTIKNAVLTSLDMLLPWGGSMSSYSSPIKRGMQRSRLVDRVSYDRAYRDRDHYDRERERYHDDTPNWEEDITFRTYADAKEALRELEYVLDTYGKIRITDLYDLKEKSIGRYGITLRHYGWVDLRGVQPVRIGDRWALSFPKAFELD